MKNENDTTVIGYELPPLMGDENITENDMRAYARQAIAPYAERIRHLQRELEQAKAAFIGSENARKDAERARGTVQSIDTPEFRNYLWQFQRNPFSTREINDLIAYIDGRSAGTAPELYTCIGKGGEYALLGTAKGAGKSRLIEPLTIYRDAGSGELYFRTADDFSERMERIAAASTPLNGKEEAR